MSQKFISRIDEGKLIVALLDKGRIIEALDIAVEKRSRPLSAQIEYDLMWRRAGRKRR